MKGITLITPQGIKYEDLVPIVKNALKDMGSIYEEAPNGDNEGYLYLGKTPNSLAIYFSPHDKLSKEDGFEDSELKTIPFEPFATDVNFRLYPVLIRLIKVVIQLFPSLYILDDQDDFLGPAEEYIKAREGK